MIMDMLTIRKATIDDINAITNIYNEAITQTVSTFDTTEKTQEKMKQWFDGHGSQYPLLVAEQDNNVVGWAALSKYSAKRAYAQTAELSLYVYQNHQGKGIGKQLMNAILKAGKYSGLHAALARITEGNEISVHLHESFGFTHVGTLKEVGWKFGKHLDVHVMEKIFE